MDDKITHGINTPLSIENHETAAWADVEKIIPESGVSIPSEDAVERAKDWVEENKK